MAFRSMRRAKRRSQPWSRRAVATTGPSTPCRRDVFCRPQNIAATGYAVQAGYFPAVVAAVRAVLVPGYNLHGTLATTHPCGPGLILSGPVRRGRHQLRQQLFRAETAPTRRSAGRFN